MSHDFVLIVDFGSQVTQLIARRVREAGVFCEIHPFSKAGEVFARLKPKLVLYQDGLNLDDLLVQTSAPRLQIGRWDGPGADTLFAVLTCCAPGEPDEAIEMTVGRSVSPHDEIRIVRPGAEEDLPDGEVGELLVRGPCTKLPCPRK